MKRIEVEKESYAALVEKFGYSNVSKALHYYSNSLMAREIRHIALNDYNGQIINLNFK